MDKNKCKLISLGKCYKIYWLYILRIIITDMAFDVSITFFLAYQENKIDLDIKFLQKLNHYNINIWPKRI